MEIILSKILLIILLTVLNLNAFSYDNLNNYMANDSTFQNQDSTSHKIWEIKNSSADISELLLSNDRIFYTSSDGLVYCYDFNGNEKWGTEVSGTILNKSNRYKDLFLTTTQQGDLYSINSNNGDVIQVVGVNENITTDLTLIDLANNNLQSKGVIFGTEDGNVFCYDIFSFELIWQINLSKHSIISNVLSVNDKVILKDSSSSIYCVNAKSGALIWKYNFTSTGSNNNHSTILSDGKNIFTLSPNNELVAIDLMLGKILWSTKPLEVIPQISFFYDKQKIILLRSIGEIIFISSNNGKELKKIEVKKKDITSFDYADTNDFSLFAFSDGSVYRMDTNFNLQKLLNADNVKITSIGIVPGSKFVFGTSNGYVYLFKID